MVIAQLTGAYVNAGDFLIQKRSAELLRYFLPSADIRLFSRKDIEKDFYEIEKCDVIVFSGGPLIRQDLNGTISLDQSMKFSKPIMLLGCGWAGVDGSKEGNYSYCFTKETIDFYTKVTTEGLGIGCRDLYTLRALNKENLSNVYMTGCPAWFNLSCMDKVHLASERNKIEKICVSDPAKSINQSQVLEVLSFLQKRFPLARITFVFHRDVDEGFRATIEDLFPKINVLVITGGAEGFSVYDDCDLHIGYRVHAHIYCLSIRKRTILIEEDGRGAGVNEALGLIRLTAYKDNIKRRFRSFLPIYKKYHPVDYRSYHVIDELEVCLNIHQGTNFMYLENAFRLQSMYFRKMEEFITRIERLDHLV